MIFVRDFQGQNRLIQDRPNDKTVEGVMIKTNHDTSRSNTE